MIFLKTENGNESQRDRNHVEKWKRDKRQRVMSFFLLERMLEKTREQTHLGIGRLRWRYNWNGGLRFDFVGDVVICWNLCAMQSPCSL